MIETKKEFDLKRSFVVNMPQMAIEALSENWLFKEIGNLHWDMICDGLHTSSFNLKNDTGSRLYATFVRIRICADNSIKSFTENENVVMGGNMQRFGNSMYLSNISFSSENETVKAELMTTFSIRDKVDNTKLAKSEPNVEKNSIPTADKLPPFGNEYRLVKKTVLKTLKYGNFEFKVGDENIYTTDYTLNPFYDLNGVNLLYFAAYPIINDVCEARFFNERNPDVRWEQNWYTKYKDVLYYANCNIFDIITYELVDFEEVEDGLMKVSSILRRKSDQVIIARIFTLKKRNG